MRKEISLCKAPRIALILALLVCLSFVFGSSLTFANPGGISTNLTLWLDAVDTATLFQDSCGGTPSTADGDRIGCWQDKSGNGHDFTASGSIRPTLKFTDARIINFNPSLVFDGSEDYLDDADGENYINGMSEFSTFVIVNADAAASDGYMFNAESGSEAESPWGLRFDDAGALSGADNTLKTGIHTTNITLYEGNEDNIALADPMLASVHWQSGEAPTLYVNGRNIALHSSQTKSGSLSSADYARVGHQANQAFWDGTIAELVLYQIRLNSTAQEKIASYLAIKYGVQLHSSIDYLDADGTVIYASTGTHITYTQDIAGIGRDSASGLSQNQSQSVNSDGIVSMQNASDLDDKEFLIWGNNNASLSEITTDVPLGYARRLNRIWRVDQAGEVGVVTVTFDLSSVSVTGREAQDFVLLVDASDTNFSVGATQVLAASYLGNITRFELVNFTGDNYFTLITHEDNETPSVTSILPSSGSKYNSTNVIEIAADVSDALSNISTVIANITLPNGTVNQTTLNFASGNKYNVSYAVPVVAGNFTITIIANDTKGNVNASEQTIFLNNLNTPLDIETILGWYDGSDNSTLFTDSSCTTQVTGDFDEVLCWENKAGKTNATVLLGKYGARYRSTALEKISSSTTLRFNKTNGTVYETGIDIRAATLEDITLFAVYRPRTNVTSDQGQAVWGNDDGSWDRFYYSLFSQNAGLGTDGIDDGLISLGGASQGQVIDGAGIIDTVFLLTAIYDGNVSGGVNSGPVDGSQIYFDGDLQVRFTDQSDDTAAETQMYLGWDGDNGGYDGDLAEVIVYEGVLNICQIELVNNYLGAKYGKDFSGISNSYGHSSPHNNDINGISEYTGNCSVNTEVTTAESSIATIFNPSSLDFNDSLTFAHDNGGFSLTDAGTGNFTQVINQSWRVDVDNTPGTVSLSFSLATTTINPEASEFALLIDSDTNFSDATVHSTGLSLVGDVVSFTNVNFSHGDYFTLAVNGERPSIDFVDPTLVNGTYHPVDNFIVNISSVSNTSDHYTFVDIDDSLYLWMRFDDVNNSGDPIDIANGNNGSLEGNALINNTGRFGDAVHFDGSGDYINLPASNSLVPNEDSWTISTWFYAHSIGSGNFDNRIVTLRSAPTLSAISLTLGESDQVQFFYRDDGGSGTTVNVSSISTNSWHHYVATYDGTTFDIFIDGVLNTTITDTMDEISTDIARIGVNPDGSSEFFNGAIDEMIFFNRSLSLSEVISLYNASLNQYSHNFTNVSDGTHSFTGHAVSGEGEKNQTEVRFVTVDTLFPGISYTANTLANNSGASQDYVFVEVTVIEQNEANITFRLANMTVLLNTSFFANQQRSVNFTSLEDGVYFYNVTVFDLTTRSNSTHTRKITLDNSPPSVSNPYPAGQSLGIGANITINATVTDNILVDTVLANVSYPNGTVDLLTLSHLGDSIYGVNFTVPETVGLFNITFLANDSANNLNDSVRGSLVSSINDPTEVNSLRLWLDAADNSTLYTDSGCSSPVSAQGQDIQCWEDKSSYKHNATPVSGKGVPKFAQNTFNGLSVVNFTKNESDTLRYELGSQYTSDFTIFVVIQSKDTNPATFESFFSNGEPASTDHFQIDYFLDNDAFRYGATTKFLFGNFSNDVKLYSVTHNGSNIVLYNEGDTVNTGATTEGRVFEHYRVNQNRAGDRHHDSYIGEIILYDRVLTECELEAVNVYLGDKYGRDFFGVSNNYAYNAPHTTDINGIGVFASNCSSTISFTSASSSIVTIYDATSLDLNDSLTFAHDNLNVFINTSAPGSYRRLSRSWRADEDGQNGVGTVSIDFDVSLNTSLLGYDNYVILIDDDADFSDATVQNVAFTSSGNTLSFVGMNVSDGEYFTLGFNDTGFPNVSIVSPLGETFIFETSINISANVTDNLEVDQVLANVTYPNGTITLLTLPLTSGSVYSTSFTVPSLEGLYNITFIANDTSGNTNASEITSFTARNTSIPSVFFVDPTPLNGVNLSQDFIYVNITSSDVDSVLHYTFTDFENSLVFWMRFDDRNASGEPVDISPNDNNGSLFDHALINTTGQFGDGSHYDGSGDYIEIPNSESLNMGTGDFTYALWFNSNEVPSGSRQLFCKRDNGLGNYEVQLESGGSIRTWIGDVGGSATSIDSSTIISANRWYHIAITRYGGNIYLYVNGNLENQTASTHNVTSTSSLFLGRDAPSAVEFFNGAIDDVLIFNRSFSTSEVQALYNATAAQYERNFSSLEQKSYTFTGYAVSANGKKNQTEARTITLVTDPPSVLVVDADPNSTFTLTEAINISANVTTAFVIDDVFANVTLPNGTVDQITMRQNTGAIYNATFIVPELLGTYTVRVIANDTVGNVNDSETTTFEVQNDVPDPTGVVINGGSAISVVSGANTTIVGTATMTDLNGYADVSSVTGYLFLTTTGVGAADNRSKHYTSSCSDNGDGSGTTVSYNCSFSVAHYAIPTDAGSNQSATNWTFFIAPLDTQTTGTNGTAIVELNTLAAFTIDPSIINFGDLNLSGNTSNINQEINVTNLGNEGLDILLSGTNLSCTVGSVSVTFLEYRNDPFTYGGGIDLSESNAELNLNATPGTAANPTPRKTTYYGLGIPAIAVGGSCNGSIVITGQSDPHGD